MSRGKGRSLAHGDQTLSSDPGTYRINIAEEIDSDFTFERFMSAMRWLDNNVDPHAWCYREMVYHFKDLEHAIDFRLRFVE